MPKIINNWVFNLAFLLDLTAYFNELNLKLQGEDQIVISGTFISKPSNLSSVKLNLENATHTRVSTPRLRVLFLFMFRI